MISDILSFLGSFFGAMISRLFKRNPNVTASEVLSNDQKNEVLQAKATASINNKLNNVDRVIDELHNESYKW